MKRIAINGFGRIGRLTLRNLLDKDVEVCAINDLTDNATLAHLFKYDTAQGTFRGEASSDERFIYINDIKIPSYNSKNPADLPWKELNIDVVLECTGRFRKKEKASLHLQAGAKRVLLSAPAKSKGIQTIVLGVNEDEIKAEEQIFSNASCTTNCLAPIVKLVDEQLGLINGSMTTVHGYTADQRLQDAPHKDLRRGRAAAQNFVPTTTGAAKALGLVYPEAKGKLMAMAVRVPVITGSFIELNINVEKAVSVEDIHQMMQSAAEGPLKGILAYCKDPIVSSDIIGNRASSIYDSLLTQVDGQFVKIVSWYDNEMGYAARLADIAVVIAGL